MATKNGTAGADLIPAFAGNNVLNGLSGDDTTEGGLKRLNFMTRRTDVHRRTRKILTLAVIFLAVVITQTAPAQAKSRGRVLEPGQRLNPGDYLKSGKVKLIMQKDGNLVLYSKRRVCGVSRTTRIGTNKADMQYDGNFVVYNYKSNPRRAVWSSGTAGGRWLGSRLKVDSKGAYIDSPIPGVFKYFWGC